MPTLSQKRQTYAMTKVQLYHSIQSQLDSYSAVLQQIHHSLWKVTFKGQLCSKILLKNSKNWVNDPKATDLVGHYKFRSWNTFSEDDLNQDVDYFVFAISQRQPAKVDLVILTPAQLRALWSDPRRKLDKQGVKHFYFSELLDGRFGESRLAKSASKNYEGWIDLPKDALNNYQLLVNQD